MLPQLRQLPRIRPKRDSRCLQTDPTSLQTNIFGDCFENYVLKICPNLSYLVDTVQQKCVKKNKKYILAFRHPKNVKSCVKDTLIDLADLILSVRLLTITAILTVKIASSGLFKKLSSFCESLSTNT